MSSSELDEEMRRNLEELDRRLDAWDEEVERMARARGFASAQEAEDAAGAESDRRMRAYEEMVEKKCAALGKTREELFPEWAGQQWVEPPSWPPCNCDGHPYPTFCPERLINFRSMDIDDFDYLGHESCPRNEELRILQSGMSRRLSEAELEKWWMKDSQQRRPELPIWAKNDGILQHIADASHVRDMARHESQSSTFTSPRDHPLSKESTVWTSRTATSSVSDVQMTEQDHTGLAVGVARETQVPPPPKPAYSRGSARANNRSCRSVTGKYGRRSRTTKQGGLCQRELASITKSNKPSGRHGMHTRSERPMEFYQLDSWSRLMVVKDRHPTGRRPK